MSEKNKRAQDLKARTEVIRVCFLIILVLATAGALVGVTNHATVQREEIRQQVEINEGVKTNEKVILWRTNNGRYSMYIGGFGGKEMSINKNESMDLVDRFIDITDQTTYLILFFVVAGLMMFIVILQAKDRTVRRVALAISLGILYVGALIYYIVRFVALVPLGIYYLSHSQLSKKRQQSRA